MQTLKEIIWGNYIILEKAASKPDNCIRKTGEHFKSMKRSIHQGIAQSKRQPSKTITLNFIKKMSKTRGKIGKFTIIVGDLKISLS